MAGVLDEVPIPIVQAPMAGGASTPELAAAVCEAGGLGFLAAGYKTADAVRDDIAALRSLTDRPFGLNLFVPTPAAADPAAYASYVERLAGEARRQGVEAGEPRFEDDGWAAKLALVEAEPVAVVSFTFGCPGRDVLARVRGTGAEAWVTVTDQAEAAQAVAAGADALVAQGLEAGGHRGSFVDEDGRGELGLLALLQLLARTVDVPLVASGGLATGAGVAAVLSAGARAAQLGTAFMRTPEAATSAPHRAALAQPGVTRVTRAFTGRRARGIVNRFLREHDAHAPVAYPEIHHVTAPLRAAAREAGDADVVNLWAGQAHELAREVPAGELVRQLAADAREALAAARQLLA
jgi:nitronate monooxygenase